MFRVLSFPPIKKRGGFRSLKSCVSQAARHTSAPRQQSICSCTRCRYLASLISMLFVRLGSGVRIDIPLYLIFFVNSSIFLNVSLVLVFHLTAVFVALNTDYVTIKLA